MKSTRFLLGLFALVALAACSSDHDLDVATDELSTDGNTYMDIVFTMSGGASTRAEDTATNTASYETGSAVEATVSSAIFLFYDASGTYVTYGTIEEGITWTTTSGSSSSVYGTSTVVLSPANTTPSQVLAVCNWPSTGGTTLIGKSLTEVLDLTHSTLPESAGSFIMTNAVLVDSSTNDFVRTTDITGENVLYEKNSSGKSVNSDDEEISPTKVTIKLERIVAKVKIGVAENADNESGNIYTTTTESTKTYSAVIPNTYTYRYVSSGSTNVTTAVDAKFKANVVGWGVNCTNSSGYLLKHYDSTWQEELTTMSEGQRSYWVDTNTSSFNWAKDANYDTDDVTKNLSYTKWSTLNGSLSTDPGYYFENTACKSAQSKYNQSGTVAVTPTVAVAATLQVSIDNGSTYGNATDLYYSGGVYFTADAILATALAEIDSEDFYYLDNNEKKKLTLDQVTSCTFTTATDTDTKPNTRYVKISGITVASGTFIYSGDKALDSYSSYTDLIDALNETSYLSTLSCFTGGACFYQAPIQHIVNTYSDNYCGLVRNHSYVITLNSITGVGNPVYDPSPGEDGTPNDDDDDDEEDVVIIPGEETTYYLNATVQLLNWVLHSQEVNF